MHSSVAKRRGDRLAALSIPSTHASEVSKTRGMLVAPKHSIGVVHPHRWGILVEKHLADTRFR